MKTKMRQSKRARKGLVLPLIIGIAVVLAILGIGFIQMGFGSRLMAAVTMSQISARASADAGLTRVVYAMNMNYRDPANPWPVNGSGTLADPYASYSYVVSPVGPLLYRVDSTGTSGRETRSVHAFATMTSRFEYALFVTNDIDMMQGASVDGYNSNNGQYGFNGNSGLPVQIGSNTTQSPQGSGNEEGIVLHSGVQITGDVAIGPGADPGEVIEPPDGGDRVSGLTYSMSEPYQWAEIEVPTVYGDTRQTIAFNNSTQSIGVGGTITTAQTIQCAVLDIGTGGILEVSGDVQLRVTQRVTLLGSNNEIRIMPGSSLRIYADGSFESGNSTLFNIVTADPKRFILYGTGSSEQTWDVRYGGSFFGVIYAPNANLVIHNSGDLYGAIAAKSCVLMSSGSLHYDQALADPSIFPAGYVVIRWWETMGP